MARDRGIVFYEVFSHVDTKLDVPVPAILLCYVFNVSFGLLYLGPAVAFSAYVASCTILLYLSYAAPIIVLLFRGRNILRQHRSPKLPAQMSYGVGLVVNIVAAIYLFITSVVSILLHVRNTILTENEIVFLLSHCIISIWKHYEYASLIDITS